MTREQLQELRKATDVAIEIVKAGPVRGPVNWAHLHCCEAKWIVNDSGQEYAEVNIQKAAPEAAGLATAVYEELIKAGWPGVVVVTEW